MWPFLNRNTTLPFGYVLHCGSLRGGHRTCKPQRLDLNPNQIAPGKTTTTETDLNLFPCGRFGRAGYPAENTVSG